MTEISQISEEFSTILLKDLNEAFHDEIDNFSQNIDFYREQIKNLINNLIFNVEYYEQQIKLISGSTPDLIKKKLQLQKDLIYKDFLQLQNLINLFIYQKIVMTYVHVDEVTGKREIRLFDNSIAHLSVTEVNNYGKSYAKLSFDVSDHYKLLKNSLPEDENSGLQITAAEVEARYSKYRGRILWKINNDWYGYKLYNRGPINEAFVAFYVKEAQLKNSLMENIHQFMLSEEPEGVIQADNANGFLLGDVKKGGLHFAVKGAFGGPQNFKMIIKWLKEIQANNFSTEAFQSFINRFKEVEQEKATSLIKPLTQRSLQGMIQYHQDKLLDFTSK